MGVLICKNCTTRPAVQPNRYPPYGPYCDECSETVEQYRRSEVKARAKEIMATAVDTPSVLCWT